MLRVRGRTHRKNHSNRQQKTKNMKHIIEDMVIEPIDLDEEACKSACPIQRAATHKAQNGKRKVQGNSARPWTAAAYKLLREEQWQITQPDFHDKNSGVGSDSFHQRVQLHLTDETCHKVTGFMHSMEVKAK